METVQRKHYLYSTWYWLNKQQERHHVDPAWETFEIFVKDLGDRPSEKHRLHKINPDLGYIPGNVIWREMLKFNPNHVRKSKTKENIRKYHLKYRYGITEEEYQNLLQTQQHCCKICNQHESTFEKPLFVDHCHSTGEVRGLLCSKCNTILGYAEDNIEVFKKAIQYLQ